MKPIHFALTAIVLLVSACAAPATAPTYSEAPAAEPREGFAVLYVYREYAEPTAWSPTIFIDGKEVVSLPQRGFSWVYLTPGKHTLASRWSFMAGPPPLEFSAEYVAGARYFYEVTGTSRLTRGATPGLHFRTTAEVRGLDERQSVRQLEQCCRFIKPTIGAL